MSRKNKVGAAGKEEIANKGVELLKKINDYLKELTINTFGPDDREKLYKFLLNFTNNEGTHHFIVDTTLFFEASKKLTELQPENEAPYPKKLRLYRIVLSDPDAKYDEIILDLFGKVLKKYTSVATNTLISNSALTIDDLKKLDLKKAPTEKTLLSNVSVPDAPTPSTSRSSSPSLDSYPSTEPISPKKPKSSKKAVTWLFTESQKFRLDQMDRGHSAITAAQRANQESQTKNTKVDDPQQKINEIKIPALQLAKSFFGERYTNTMYPLQAIILALRYVDEEYVSGKHKNKIKNLIQAIQQTVTLEHALEAINKAQSGIGYGRLNAALKRITIAVKKNEKIDLAKIKEGMDDHDPKKHNVMTRILR